MHLLAIETSGPRGGVALLLPDGDVIEQPLDDGTAHGQALVPAAAAVLDRAGLKPRDVDVVAVSIGPGSYTGLRVGVTAAKSLAWALGCRVASVSTLEALARDAAAAVPGGTSRLVPAIDARRGQVYAAVFDLAGGVVARASDDEALAPGELSGRLRAGDHVFGTALEAYAEALALPAGATGAGGPASPRAATVARIGAELAMRGEFREVHNLAPAYLRRTEAEVNLDRKASRG